MNHNGNIQAETYDHFRMWLIKHMRVRPNDKIDTRAFGDLNTHLHGPSHMIIYLENVQQGNSFLFSKIKEYNKDASIVGQDSVDGKGIVYVAHVPYHVIKTQKRSHHYHHRHGKSSPPPNTMYLFGYIFMLMLLVIVASIKTTRSDWQFIL